MLSRDQTMDILLLHKQGHSIRRIARGTGHSRNTGGGRCVQRRRRAGVDECRMDQTFRASDQRKIIRF
jgi:transposase